MVESPTLK